VAMTIQHAGTESQRRRWLPELASGARIATVAATESGAGSDVASVASTITEEAGGYVARGHKRYVTFADRAGLFLFIGRASGRRGLTAALVPRLSNVHKCLEHVATCRPSMDAGVCT